MAKQSQDKRLAIEMKKHSEQIESTPIPIFKLAGIERRLSDKMLCRVEIGHPSRKNKYIQHKVLMVVGATGAGKSTLINGMVNYILQVDWKDDFRFKLIADQVKSKPSLGTSDITAYTIHHMDGSRVPYSITIIDTPRFGKGLERDKEIMQQIKEFLSLRDGNGIDYLDAIALVTQSALVQLTATPRYIFDSILSVFGKDVAANICIMVTFCDVQDPPVIEAVKAGNVPFCSFFKFNNSALFAQRSSTDDSDDDSDDESFVEMFWNMGMKSFKKFFAEFQKAQAVSLTLTREVLEIRQKLEAAVQGLQRQIDTDMEVLRQEELVLQKYEAEIAANKDFSYNVEVPYYETIKIPQGHTGERFELKKKMETRYIEDLKKKYDDATSKKAMKDKLIDGHARELERAYTQLHSLVEEIRNCLDILNDIALKPDPLTHVDYIELLIDSEKSQAKPGWQDRVKCLMKAKDQAELMAKISTGDDKTGSVPFEELEQVKRIQKRVAERKRENAGFLARMSKGTKQTFGGLKTMFGSS